MKPILGTILGWKKSVPPHAKNANSSKLANSSKNSTGDRRSEERIGDRQRVYFFSPGCPVAHEGIWINGSDGGAFIETNSTLPLLTVIRIEAPGLLCQAKVCRVHWLRPDERTQRSSGMAVQLLSVKQESVAPTTDAIKSTDVTIPLVDLGPGFSAS